MTHVQERAARCAPGGASHYTASLRSQPEKAKMFRRNVVFALCLAILNLGSPLVAHASLVGTLQAVESNTRAANLATVNGALARAEVREQMAALGVAPADIDARVARLTDTELNTLAG